MSGQQQGLDLTEGRVSTLLLRFSAPFLAANLVTALYGIVGMLVISRFTTPTITSGVASGTQIMNLMYSFTMGLGTGGTVLIGRCIGERNKDAGTKATGSFFIVTLALIAFLTLLIWFGRELLLDLLKTQPDARASASRYVMLCTIGVPFNVGYAMLGAIFRGMGNSKAPSVVAAVSCAVNIALSFLLVGALRMEEAGVAVATSCAQVISFVHIAIWLYRKKLPFPFKRSDLRSDGKSTKYIFTVGMPIVLQELLITISFMIITNRVNSISIEASASVGVVARAFNIAFVLPLAIGSAISAMTAQNLGAGKRDRALASLRWGILYAFIIDALIFLFCQLSPETITAIFSNDEAVMRGAASYLRTFSADALFVAFIFCLNSYLGGCGKSNISMAHSLIATFCIRVPLSIYFTGLDGIGLNEKLSMLGFAAPIASVFSVAVCLTYVFLQERKHKKTLPVPAEIR